MAEKTKDIAKKDSDKAKKDKNGLFQKIGKFFREYKSELKKISWPTFPEVVKNSLITLLVVAVVGVVIWLADWGLTTARTAILGAIKTDEGTGNNVSTVVTLTDEELAKMAAYGVEGGALVSGSDLFVSGSDVYAIFSNTDLYAYTVNGEVVAYDVTENAAKTALKNYLANLPAVELNSPTDETPTDITE